MKKLHIATTLLLSVLTATASFASAKESYSEKVAPTDPLKVLQQHQERIGLLEEQRQMSLSNLQRILEENTAKKSEAEQFLKLFDLAEKTTAKLLENPLLSNNEGKTSAASAFASGINSNYEHLKNLSGVEELLDSLNKKIEATKAAIIELGGTVPGSEISISDSVKVDINSSSVVSSPIPGDQSASKPLSKKQQRKLAQQAKKGTDTPQ